MKYGFIKVAAATPTICVGDPKFNREQIQEKIRDCISEGARIIVFPELVLSGFTCQDLFLQDSLLEECKHQLEILARETKDTQGLIFVGLPWKRQGKLYNVAAVLNRGKVLAIIPKQNLPNYGEFDEARWFTPGSARVEEINTFGYEIPFGGGILLEEERDEDFTIGCEICEDLWVLDPPSTALACSGATILVNLSASNETVHKDDYRRMLVSSASFRLASAYVYACAGEGESTQDVVFSGHNLIAENGSILAESPRFMNHTAYAQIDVKRLVHERRRRNTWPKEGEKLRRIPFNLGEEEEFKLERKFSRFPFVPDDDCEKKRRAEDILAIQYCGLKKRFSHTGIKRAIIGISGGLDSTLALLVTVRTFDLLGIDRKNIHSITMPCFGTTGRTYDNACKLARVLGTTLEEIDIREAVQMHFRDIGQEEKNHDAVYENSQARERTQVLMDIANRENGLVVGTGDMSELALGWATYNGDHMSMYGVNAGVPKTLVRHLVRCQAQECQIPELKEVLLDILDTPVSPELLPPREGEIEQKTEDLVGPYELHDFFLYYILRWGFAPKKIYEMASAAFASEYDRKVILYWLKTFYRRFFSQQFKRSCLPDGPKVGSVALSPRGDLRMPSDASARLWMEELEGLN